MVVFLIIVIFILSFQCLKLYARCKLWDMHTSLEEWIVYNVGDDIVKCREQRKEYAYYVDRLVDLNVQNIPKKTIIEMRKDLRSKGFRPIYFHLIWLDFKRFFGK